jgi:hypothetical protein
MKIGLRRIFSSWLDVLRKVGVFVLLVAGSAGLGLLIAWPLWLFATSSRRIYSIVVLSLLFAGLVFLVVRGILRRRSRMRDPGQPRRNALTFLITTLIVAVAITGAYAAAVLFSRRLWVLAVLTLLAWGGLLWFFGFLRRCARARKAPALPAENRGE